MCTLSVIQIGDGGYRAVHSRDEQRSRGTAYPPAWRTLDSGLRVQYPTDSDAGGTWVVTSDRGVTTGVLNYNNPEKTNPNASRSRGEIPLALIELPNLETMLSTLQAMDLSYYATFTGFAIETGGGDQSGVRMLVVQWDGSELGVVRNPSDAFEPIAIASSGLGDEFVQGRLPLFEELVAGNPTAESQDRYTMHRWDDCLEYSVLMSRKDARTVSITSVEVNGEDEPMMEYQELPENDPSCDPVGAGMLQ